MTDSDAIKKIVDKRLLDDTACRQHRAQTHQLQSVLFKFGLPILVVWIGGSVTWAITANAEIRANRERQDAAVKRQDDYARQLDRMEDKLDRLIERQ